MAVMVAARPLILRAGSALQEDKAVSCIAAGTTVLVLQATTLSDGTLRAQIARQGAAEPAGWVSWMTAAGQIGLVARGLAFKVRRVANEAAGDGHRSGLRGRSVGRSSVPADGLASMDGLAGTVLKEAQVTISRYEAESQRAEAHRVRCEARAKLRGYSVERWLQAPRSTADHASYEA